MVNNLIKNGRDLLFRRQTNILSAATVIAAAVLLSRLLGLFKYRLLTGRFSVSDIGVFITAFRLPNTVFDLIVMGALTTAFIPVFTSYIAKDKTEDANRIASTVLNLSILIFLLFSFLFFVFTDPLMHLIAPGLSPREMSLAIPFTRIMLLGQTLPLILGNFLTGILQSHKRFLVPALAPVVYNIGIILGILFLSPSLGLYGAVWGVVLGAFLFMLIQIPLCAHLDFHYQLKFDLRHPGVTEIGRLIVPRTLGLAVTQLNYFANLAISSLISTRAITIFSFAQQLEQLPIGVFAATIAQAALPTLSEEHGKDDNFANFKKTFLTSLHQILFLVCPAAAILIVLRIPIVRLVYGASKFDWPATVETGRTLAFLSIGLIAEAAINLLVRGFYALHNSKTPVIVGSLTVLLNIALSFSFIFLFPIWGKSVLGLAAASAIADSLYALILIYLLNRAVHSFEPQALLLPAGKILFAAALTGFSLYVPMKLLDQLVFDTTRTAPLIMLSATVSLIGLTVYLFLTWVLQIEELKSFLSLFGQLGHVFFAAEDQVERAVSDVVTETAPVEIPPQTPEVR
ncbi:murein biosynthesis integral membrane protein MurJ [Patescibacteria group bacterium]|nr:murein biosynthesis integral membrane protein MurJ [Patescibacteria group bacterium]